MRLTTRDGTPEDRRDPTSEPGRRGLFSADGRHRLFSTDGRRALLAAGGWLATAALTTLTGIWAVSLIGTDITGQAVRSMTLREVEQALTSPSPPPAVAFPSPSGPYAATGNFAYAEGSVAAACDAGRALLLSWTPAQGYGVEEVERGPAATVSVVFESDDRSAAVQVTCPSGTPVAEVRPLNEKEDD
ncbi:hypothetical protein [Planobispora takensis]|uniref:Septum formation initiator n=1 Tax=Planobispora takensis TaxID=1367882 RepID=A0A8J3SZC4_9ACTN|nr:hypothetical protein [Planobispora takensis]GII01488.1 hypothetical protein Pta02_34960 [Planobispora takensis]